MPISFAENLLVMDDRRHSASNDKQQAGIMQAPDQHQIYTPETLKILIVSTPKTGNTWLRHLLAAIYDLPTAKLDFPFDSGQANAHGERWIAHQHYTPEPALRDWAMQHKAVLVTTIRHPGDVLISLYHHVRSLRGRFNFYQLGALADDDGTFGEPVRAVVHTVFKDILGVSVDWMATGITRAVRYEELYYNPVDTLAALTDTIIPVSRDAVERAVERCDINVMRSLAFEDRSFYRKGGTGGWRDVLPATIVDLLRTTEPYPAQFAALGYTLDAEDSWRAATPRRLTPKAAFLDQCGHSSATTSLLKTIFLSFDSADAQRMWPEATRTSAFHKWLNAPADANLPLVTNLAAFIWQTRLDVRAAFPDLYGQDRIDALFWIVAHAAQEYELEDEYIAPLHRSLVAWAAQPDAHDTALHADLPLITNLAACFYNQRPDLQAAFPDLYGQHRLDVLMWTVTTAPQEYHLDAAYVAPLRQSLAAWAARPDMRDSAPENGVPTLTNLVACIYQRRPDLQAAFPDLYGRHRMDMLLWTITNAPDEYPLGAAAIAPLRQRVMAWALDSRNQHHWRKRNAYLSRAILAQRHAHRPGDAIIRAINWLLTRR
jgi:hypothetical protein